ncbi:MAG: sulfatase-like hydrolase/transferase [Oceanospirillaceae bacterium]|nr:sulfatase-like hydrolase/transferase [Oceanospirillaceae bacterium]
MRQPNFIIFMTDQQRADHLGCYGNPLVQTPHIDSLAQRGVRFERFYVSTPICQPNRACLATGQLPSVNGVRQNGIPMSLQSTTFADVLRGDGYNTGLIGKAHFQNVTDIPAPARVPPGEGRLPDEGAALSNRAQRGGSAYDYEIRDRWARSPEPVLHRPYYGFDHVRLCVGHGDQVEGHYSAWLRARHPASDSLRGPANALPSPNLSAPQAWRTALPEALYPTRFIEEEACAFLEQQAPDGAPFALLVSFPDPHHPFTPPGRYWSMYDPDEVRLPASFRHPVDRIPGIPESVLEAYRWGDRDNGSHWPFHIGERQARELIALNYGSISMVDDAIGSILGCLERRGLDDDTVLLFTADHGDYMGDHGAMLKMGLHYQSVIRVPFIWYDPRRSDAGRVDDRLGSAIDLAPTLLQRAGLRRPVGMQGIDLFGDRRSDSILIEDPGIRVFRDSDARSRITTLVTADWRLSLHEGEDWGELYNLRDDPDEMENLWHGPALLPVKAQLFEQLLQRIVELRDLSLSPTARA